MTKSKFQIFKEKSKSFTLLEILTVVFLGSIIIMAGYSVYLISYKSYQRNSQSSELAQNARIALERMSREIRQTVDILTVLPETPEEGTPAIELKFQDGHNFADTGKIQYITYYLSGTDLYRKTSHYCFDTAPDDWVLWSTKDHEGNSPTEQFDLDQMKAQKITSLQFWGDKTITIHLTVSDGASTYTFETKTLGRNIQ